MSSFKNADAGVIVDQLIKTIQKERDYLSEIDGKIGDGDHGINMNKGFTMCEKKLEGTTYNLSEGLTTLGETLLEDIGGSMGPLYGMLFDEMAQHVKMKKRSQQMYSQNDHSLCRRNSGYQPCTGRRQITARHIDSSKRSICRSKRSRKRLCRMFGCYECRSRKGWQSTKDLVAKIGRASRLGERSRGVLDAGATSCYFIITTTGSTAKSLL